MSSVAEEIRSEFPFFAARPDIAYFDNAATTQRPQRVIDAMTRHMTFGTANTGRSSHHLAGALSQEIERIRAQVAMFINADADGIAFTSGATASLNAVVQCWGRHNLHAGDEILVSRTDHSANTEPWRRLAIEIGLEIVEYNVTASGDADLRDVVAKTTPRTRVLAITHVHNVFGERASIHEFRAALPSNIVISVDAAQSAGHTSVDANAMGVDFISFSAHKMFGPPGIGALWVSPRVRNEVGSKDGGGRPSGVPEFASRLELGTINTVGIIGFGEAIAFLSELAGDVEHRLANVTHSMIDALRSMPQVELLPGVAASACRQFGYGIVSFRVANIDSADIGFILDNNGICVRTGSHCTSSDLTENSVRISAHAYNTDEEIERLLGTIRRCRK